MGERGGPRCSWPFVYPGFFVFVKKLVIEGWPGALVENQGKETDGGGTLSIRDPRRGTCLLRRSLCSPGTAAPAHLCDNQMLTRYDVTVGCVVDADVSRERVALRRRTAGTRPFARESSNYFGRHDEPDAVRVAEVVRDGHADAIVVPNNHL